MDMLTLERVWEDEDFFELEITAKTNTVWVKSKFYTTNELIDRLASEIMFLLKDNRNRFFWANETRSDGLPPSFSLRVSFEDKLGHIKIDTYVKLDDDAFDETHSCSFLIRTEYGALERFGKELFYLTQRGIGFRAELA